MKTGLCQNENMTIPATDAAKQWDGWGTALKPAHEPICVARKPLSEKTVAANVLKWGTGAINVDGCRVETAENCGRPQGTMPHPMDWCNKSDDHEQYSTNTHPRGRFPANVIHDGSAEVLAGFPETAPSCGTRDHRGAQHGFKDARVSLRDDVWRGPIDSGSAARFFYCAKASKSERDAGIDGMQRKTNMRVNAPRSSEEQKTASTFRNHHPTVKPLSLMRYLCRLVTQPEGIVLEPFCGSGTTCVAAIQEGFRFLACEREAAYIEIARARIAAAQNATPLFAEASA